MKQVVEAYVGLWVIMLILWIAIAFTTINLHVAQARKTYNDIKAEIQACNGAFNELKNAHDGTSNMAISISEDNSSLEIRYGQNTDSYNYIATISKVENREYTANNETFIYNDLYKIDLKYYYIVPLFGRQLYPQVGYAY